MQFLKDLFLGLRSYWKAILFIKTHKIYWYILIPAVFMIGIYKLGEMIKAKQYTPHVSNMNEIVWFMLQLLLEISIALLLMNFAKYLVVIILSPLLAHLSQKTEHKLTGNIYPFEMGQFLKDIKRGVRIALRNLLWQYLFFLIIFVVSFLGWKDPKSSPVFYLIFGIAFYYFVREESLGFGHLFRSCLLLHDPRTCESWHNIQLDRLWRKERPAQHRRAAPSCPALDSCIRCTNIGNCGFNYCNE